MKNNVLKYVQEINIYLKSQVQHVNLLVHLDIFIQTVKVIKFVYHLVIQLIHIFFNQHQKNVLQNVQQHINI